VMQVAGLALLVLVAALGEPGALPASPWELLLFLSLPLTLALLLLAVLLDRAPGDLRHAWTLPLWPFYSTLMSLVMLRAMWLELRGAENRWNKMERSGTVSVDTGQGP